MVGLGVGGETQTLHNQLHIELSLCHQIYTKNLASHKEMIELSLKNTSLNHSPFCVSLLE